MTTDAPAVPAGSGFTVPTTRILAIGRVTEKGAGTQRSEIMPHEVRETVRLHLAGRIDQWFTQTQAAGVVFILNMDDVDEARAMLGALPLGQAGMMEFELIAMGPLKPLHLLV